MALTHRFGHTTKCDFDCAAKAACGARGVVRHGRLLQTDFVHVWRCFSSDVPSAEQPERMNIDVSQGRGGQWLLPDFREVSRAKGSLPAATVHVPVYPVQDTRGFHIENTPFGLYFQAHTCRL